MAFNLNKLTNKIKNLSIARVARERMSRRLARRNPLYHYVATFSAARLIIAADSHDKRPEPGYLKNFIGVKIRPDVMPSVIEPMVGSVEGPPAPGNWHADIAEWGAAFHAVDNAGDTFRMVELGCGWGCWMVNTGAYARQHGKKVILIGIEGNPGHLRNAETTLRDNGFGHDEFRLINGIAGPKEGVAIFPKEDLLEEHWGAEAVFYPSDEQRIALLATGQYQELPCFPLDALAEGMPLDLLHVDIQGAEVDFVQGNIDGMTRTVRRVLIGTHSRAIEGQLTSFFVKHGWQLEMERTAVIEIDNGMPSTVIDGVQMWHNPAL